MIIFVRANLKKIFNKQREYVWPRPEVCPRCEQSSLWGHGFVLAYFDDAHGGVYLRRYRCPGCGCVIRLRPRGYFARIQASIRTIRSSLSKRIDQGRYLPGLSRSRQRHWVKALIENTVACLGHGWKVRLIEAFDRLVSMGKVPVSGSM
jgi:ribosomal protein S27AE